MRNAFADEIRTLALADPRVVLLCGDIGNRLFNRYKDEIQNRQYNCGIAEQSMIGIAAGMAMAGLRPVAYTIAPFLTTRVLEQIRVDLCYHNLPVTIVGTGAGLSYANLGATHHSCEDIAFLRVIPNMTVLCPGDSMELRAALAASLQHDGPVYLRIGKKGEPVIHETQPAFKIGDNFLMREGKDVWILGVGNMLPTALEVADRLTAEGISTGVYSVPSVKPLDVGMLAKVFDSSRLVVTLEEHSRLGGFGGSVAEWLCDQPQKPARLCRIGTPDEFFHTAGWQEYARRVWGLDVDGVLKQIHAALPA